MKLSLKKNIDALREGALAQIAVGAQEALARYKSPSEYVAKAHARKQSEHAIYKQDSSLTADELPIMFSEAEALGTDIHTVAAIWDQKMKEESLIISRIEAIRLTANKKVREATTPTAINEVIARIEWP